MKDKADRGAILGMRLSLPSKVVTVVLNFLAIPYAVTVVGMGEFAIYVAATSLISIVFLGQIGAGPGVTRRVSVGLATKDQTEINRLVTASIVLMTGLAIVIATAGIVVANTGAISELYKLNGEGNDDTLRISMIFVIAITCAQLIMTAFLRIQAGFHEGYLATVINTVWAVAAILLILLWLPYSPTALSLLLVIFGTMLGSAATSSALFVWRHRARLRPEFRGFWSTVAIVVAEGVSFTVFELSSGGIREVMKPYLSQAGGAVELARYGILLQFLIATRGIAITVISPNLPRLSHLSATGNYNAISNYHRKYNVLAWGCGLILTCSSMLLGPMMAERYLNPAYQLNTLSFLALSVGALFVSLKFLNAFTLIALSRMKTVAAISAVEGAVALLVIHHVGSELTAETALLILAFTSMPSGVLVFPALIRRSLRHQSSK